MPSVPGSTAVTETSLVWHLTSRLGGVPDSCATGSSVSSSVLKAIPPRVRTVVPRGIVYDALGSQLVQRTPPLAAVCSTRLAVAGNSADVVTGTLIVWAGMIPRSVSTAVAPGSARTVSEIGPMATILGVTVIWAEGSSRYAATPATATARTRMPRPTMAPAPRRRRAGACATRGSPRPRAAGASSNGAVCVYYTHLTLPTTSGV